jgi:hypothetical protein
MITDRGGGVEKAIAAVNKKDGDYLKRQSYGP